MPMRMNVAAQQRALQALALMIQEGKGVMEAAKLAGSSRRSIRKYMRLAGIRGVIKKGKLHIVKTMEQKIHEFILHMSRGDSATAAAKKAHTQVRTMSRKEVDGSPIIVKVGNKWVLNAYPLYRHMITLYGHIVGLGDSIQGQYEEDGEIKSPDAPSIWWQIDFDDFVSTLPSDEVGQFWAERIVEWLRNEMQLPVVLNNVLSERFLGNEEVFNHADEQGRIGADGVIRVTKLEDLMSRYNVRLHDYVNYGIDDNHEHRELNWISKDNLGEESAIGLFMVIFRDEEDKTYPSDAPLELIFDYNLQEERD